MKKDPKNILVYQAKNGEIKFRGDFSHEDLIWGSLKQIAELFGRDKSVISRHIKNIFKSGELDKNAVVAKIATIARDEKSNVQKMHIANSDKPVKFFFLSVYFSCF